MPTPPLHEELENIRVGALKEAFRVYSERVEQGMNLMVQRAQQRASAIPASDFNDAPVNPAAFRAALLADDEVRP